MQVKKIAVKIWQPVMDKLDKKIEAACLRRDAFISKILATEVEYIDEEVTESNSEEARDFVLARLKLLPTKVVTFTMPVDLIDRIDTICSQKRIVRDAIFNRILLLLTLTPTQIDRLLRLDENWRLNVWDKHVFDWNFFPDIFYPFEPIDFPFIAIREAIHLRSLAIDVSDSLSTILLTDRHFKDVDLYGLNCYVPDVFLPDRTDQWLLDNL
ncbi:MAG: hypothetical protein Q8M99_05390 [Methylotenera sp.]|nr:hypothetical protein [Methylotenera sp.]